MKKKIIAICLLFCFLFPQTALALDDVTVQRDDPLTEITMSGNALPNTWVTMKVTDTDGTIWYFGSQKSEADTSYTFTMDLSGAALPLDVTLSYADHVETAVIQAEKEVIYKSDFTDIRGKWYEETVDFLAGKGIVKGRSETIFDPDSKITRAEFLTLLARCVSADVSAAKDSGFADVDTKAWYAKYINWGAEEGIIRGYSPELCGPNDPITREQMAVMVTRLAAAENISLTVVQEKPVFKDGDAVSRWAKDAMDTVQKAGLLLGYPDGTLQPQGNATRAEAATVVKRLYDKF
jgi:hypothetical protein